MSEKSRTHICICIYVYMYIYMYLYMYYLYVLSTYVCTHACMKYACTYGCDAETSAIQNMLSCTVTPCAHRLAAFRIWPVHPCHGICHAPTMRISVAASIASLSKATMRYFRKHTFWDTFRFAQWKAQSEPVCANVNTYIYTRGCAPQCNMERTDLSRKAGKEKP